MACLRSPWCTVVSSFANPWFRHIPGRHHRLEFIGSNCFHLSVSLSWLACEHILSCVQPYSKKRKHVASRTLPVTLALAKTTRTVRARRRAFAFCKPCAKRNTYQNKAFLPRDDSGQPVPDIIERIPVMLPFLCGIPFLLRKRSLRHVRQFSSRDSSISQYFTYFWWYIRLN